MDNALERWSRLLGGSSGTFSLEHRILNYILLVAALCFITGILVTFTFDLPINAVDIIAFPTYLLAYIISRYGRQFVIAMVLFTLVNLSMFNFSWLASHAINGPILYLFLTFTFLNFVLMNFKTGVMVNLIFVIDAIALIYLQGTSSRYDSELQRQTDFVLHIILVTCFFAFVTNYLKKAYTLECKRSEEYWQQRLKLQSNMINESKISAVGRLAAGIAHEILLPLNSIKQTNESIKEIVSHPPINLIRFDQLYQQIITDLSSISGTTQSLLQFSQEEDNEPGWIEVQDLINEARLLTKISLQSQNPTFLIEIAPNAKKLWGVQSQILTVMTTLLLNCKESTVDQENPNLEIVIHTELQPQKFMLSIKDNGRGLTDVEQRNLFDPFDLEKTQKQSKGLGLPIIYGIIKLHGGEIKVLSSPNQGTEFQIIFPHKNL